MSEVVTFLTPEQVARRLQVAPYTVRRWFQNEPGVVQLQLPSITKRRQRIHLRIPEPVLQRWIERRSTGPVIQQRKGMV